MTERMLLRCAPIVLVLLSGAGWMSSHASGQGEQPEMTTGESQATFNSKVNLVLVPVVVRDAKGHAIGTLRKEDFELFDKGKRQVISRFSVEKPGSLQALQKAATPDSPAEETNPKDPAAAMPQRYVVYLFDDLNISVADLMRVQKAALNHLAKALQPADRAAIYTTSGRGNLDFTDDQTKIREAVSRLRSQPMYSHPSNDCPDLDYYMADLILNKNDQQALQAATADTMVCASLTRQSEAQQLVQSTASQLRDIGEQGTRVTLSVFRDVVRRLSAVPGQRTVILVSPGFLTLTPESLNEITDVLDRSARANVMISALDARGLYTASDFDASKRGSSSPQMSILKSQYGREAERAQADVLAEMADGTGGTFFQNNNDLEAGLDRIAAAPEYMYTLGFSPQNMKADGTFHRLKVTVQNGKGLALQARRGYLAPKKITNAEDNAKAEIQDAIYSREELHDLPVDLHTQFFKPDPADAKLTVIARVDLKHMRFKRLDGRNQNHLTVVSVLFDRDGNYVMGKAKTIDMHLRDETLARLDSGITVKTDFQIKPGTYLVRLVVRDQEGQLMSAENAAVDIP